MQPSPFVQGSHSLLKTASKKLRDMGYISLRVLGDHKGVFCIEYPKFYLTANQYLYKRSVVSNQKDIIFRARHFKKDIVVYVEQTNRFYIFNPEDILNNHWENIKGDPSGYHLVMYNWDINLGKELLT